MVSTPLSTATALPGSTGHSASAPHHHGQKVVTVDVSTDENHCVDGDTEFCGCRGCIEHRALNLDRADASDLDRLVLRCEEIEQVEGDPQIGVWVRAIASDLEATKLEAAAAHRAAGLVAVRLRESSAQRNAALDTVDRLTETVKTLDAWINRVSLNLSSIDTANQSPVAVQKVVSEAIRNLVEAMGSVPASARSAA